VAPQSSVKRSHARKDIDQYVIHRLSEIDVACSTTACGVHTLHPLLHRIAQFATMRSSTQRIEMLVTF
jgi:hypothetical protein